MSLLAVIIYVAEMNLFVYRFGRSYTKWVYHDQNKDISLSWEEGDYCDMTENKVYEVDALQDILRLKCRINHEFL